MTRDITHVHATKNSTELRKSVHVDPIVKFKVSKKTPLVNWSDPVLPTWIPKTYHRGGKDKTSLRNIDEKTRKFNDQDLEKYFAEKVGGPDGSIWAWIWEISSTYRQSLKKEIWIYK